MHVLVVHSDPRFYRELRGLLSAQEATGAYIPNLSEIRAQIEAHFPDLIVLEPVSYTHLTLPTSDLV